MQNKIFDILSLSPFQEGVLFHYLQDSEDPYITQNQVNLVGKISIESLRHAMTIMTTKHDALRSIVVFEKLDKPRLVVLREQSIDVEYIDLSMCTDYEIELKYHRYRMKDLQRGFNLQKGPLVRLVLFKVQGREDSSEYRLLVTSHHIIMDGWCIKILFEDLIHYSLQRNLSEIKSVCRDKSFAEYLYWRDRIDQNKSKEYWKNKFDIYKVDIDAYQADNSNMNYMIPFLKYDVNINKHHEISKQIDKDLYTRLVNLSKRLKLTLNSILQSAWAIVLGKYTDNNKVIFGTVVSGRPDHIKGIESSIGAYINTIPVCCDLTDRSFETLARELHSYYSETLPHQYLSITSLQSLLENRKPLFDHLFVFQNFNYNFNNIYTNLTNNVHVNGFVGYEKTNYPLTLVVNDYEELTITAKYNAKSIATGQVNRLISHWLKVLDQVAEQPYLYVNQVDILTKEERYKVLVEFNNTKRTIPDSITVIDLFNEQVKMFPNKTAIIDEISNVTYCDLNRMANRVTSHLLSNHCKPDEVIGLISGNSIELIAAMIGILKCGAAFLPIDAKQPEKRIKAIIQRAKVKTILCSNDSLNNKINYKSNIFKIENINSIISDKNKQLEVKETAISQDQVAYVIFTSGSTGEPKGVPVKHLGLLNLCRWYKNVYEITKDCKTTKYTSPGFDASILEIFPYISVGASIYIVPEEARLDTLRLKSFIDKNKITHTFLPTAVCETFLQQESGCSSKVNSLRALITGGDKLNNCYTNNRYKVFNNYGPTENSVITTFADVTKLSEEIHIGKPIDNTKVFVLDKNMSPCPIGVPGEIYISGIGLSDGYINNSEQTEISFLSNPIDGNTIYKSGDWGFWTEHGNLHYIGRIDDQFQLYGQRIECGEIEAIALKADIIQCKVLLINSEIILFYVQNKSKINNSNDEFKKNLKKVLTENLPVYMVPSRFIRIHSMPLTVNGKTDVNKLIKNNINKKTTVNNNQNTIKTHWQTEHRDVLEFISMEMGVPIENLSPEDNLFSIGGDSIKAMRLVAYIHKNYGIDIGVAHIFRHPKLMEIFQSITSNTKKTITNKKQLYSDKNVFSVDRCEQPTSEQARQFFITSSSNTTAYNVTNLFKLPDKLNIDKLHTAFKELVRRHISLRTAIINQDGILKQKVLSENGLLVEKVKISKSITEEITTLIKPFDLSNELPIRIFFIFFKNDKYLLLDIHHIAIDIGSMSILLSELEMLLHDKVLPKLKYNYMDYCVWRNKSANINDDAEAFWKKKLHGIGRQSIIKDYISNNKTSVKAGIKKSQISIADTNQIYQYCKNNGLSPYVFFLGALAITLNKLTLDKDFIIGSPVDLRRLKEFESVVGMLTTTLPLRIFTEQELSVRELLDQAKHTLADTIQYAYLPFEKIVALANKNKDIVNNPLFDLMLVVTGEMQNPNYGSSLKSISLDHPGKYAKFDILIDVSNTEDRIDLRAEYNEELYRGESIEQLLGALHRVCIEMVRNDYRKLEDIDAIGPAQYDFLINGINKTQSEYNDQCLLQDYLANAIRTGKNPNNAIIYNESGYSLVNWDKQSNRIANYLRSHGVGRHDKVGILMDRSYNMIVAIMAVLKSGAAYVPLNKSDPITRIDELLKRAECSAVFIDSRNNNTIELQSEILKIDISAIKEIDLSSKLPTRINEPTDPAVIIHTSGSTGIPKGVIISHRMINNAMCAMQKYYPMNQGDTYLFKTPLVFDVSFTEIFSFLIGGGRVVLMPKMEEKDPELIAQYIRKYHVTHVNFIPSMLDAFLLYHKNSRYLLEKVKYLFIAGEKLMHETVSRLCDYQGSYCIVNIYGPSETFYTTHYKIDKSTYNTKANSDIQKQSIPIGRPFDNLSIYLLNGDEPVPYGAVGELCVSGDGVANGYIDKSQEINRFTSNCFQPQVSLYRTGDLARYRYDGQLEYYGRRDRQLKIAGRRVECGEIEQEIMKLPEIDLAVVRAWSNKDTDVLKLYAYVCLSKMKYPDSSDKYEERFWLKVREALYKKLPQHMIPADFIVIKSVPRTASGKVDILKLPEPVIKSTPVTGNIIPTTEADITMQSLWEKALNLPRSHIYSDSDFFHLGGTSLDIIRLVSLIKSKYDTSITVESLFQYRKLSEMARMVEQGRAKQHNIPSQVTCFEQRHNALPVFCIPGINGHALMFKDLVKALSGMQFYCLEPIDLQGKSLVDMGSIGDICQSYIKTINEVQPEGPYVIMGHSSGGLIALKLAQWLTDQGQVVTDVILFDSFCYYQGDNREWVKSRSDLEPYSAAYIDHIFAGFERYLGHDLGINESKLKRMHECQRLDYVAEQLASSHITPNKDVKFVKKYLNARNIHEKLITGMLVSSQRDTYGGKVTLVKAKQLLSHQTLDPRDDYGWNDFIKGDFEIITSTGNHENMLFGENAIELAKKLSKIIGPLNYDLNSEPNLKIENSIH